MKKPSTLGALSFILLALTSCSKQAETTTDNGVKEEIYGKMPDGREVRIFTLTNKNGLKARVTEYGAILVSMETPDKSGKFADITHGYETLAGWLTNTSYFGSSVGRFGNRIKDGKFTLEGKEYKLATNNDPGGIPCHLHGGTQGFDKVLWSGKPINSNGVELTYLSKDGEEGYPGNLSVKVTYTLTADNELKWETEATTDAPTILNVVHHSYWNLSGDPNTSINDHLLTLNAPSYLPTDVGLIPTGEIAPVAGTPMDFTKATSIGERLAADFEALKFGGGYDHAWVLEKGEGVRLASKLHDPKSGRTLEISTNQAAIQFYGGNFLDGTVAGKGGVKYPHRSALCLETEGFPDAPNKPNFPSSVLRPGETYRHTMIHKFSVE
jgi:aldose 1-epimerase